MKPDEINWGMNQFMKPFEEQITNEFKEFWLNTPAVNHEDMIDTDEYWIRCAFCWIGWGGHESRVNQKKKVKYEKKTKKS